MALALSPHNAHRLAAVLAPSMAVRHGISRFSRKLECDSRATAKGHSEDRPSLSLAVRAGAQRGLQAGEAVSALVCGLSFTAHAAAPQWASSHLPLPGMWGYALRGVASTKLHGLCLNALDVAAAGNHRRLQITALAILVATAVITEPTRLRAALVWAVPPLCGALVGATMGLGVYCAGRLADGRVVFWAPLV